MKKSMKKIMKDMIIYLVKHRVKLSKNKSSGVYFIENFNGKDVYRVHLSSFIPKIFNSISTNDIALVVNRSEFKKYLEWDSQTLWLTIDK